jgi:acetoin utilization deacetylase AcuC-like enzyme
VIVTADDVFLSHDTGAGHPECPDRARVIAAALRTHPLVQRVDAATAVAALDDLARVHDRAYVEGLAARVRGAERLDADTAVSPLSFEVALKAAGSVVQACERAVAGTELRSFSVVRPPGHHARPARAMGFCLLNNVAVAAATATGRLGLSRVAVIDFDVHHGNGTQEMFWKDGGVLYVSLHRYPFYPGTGAADETGEGKGKGAIANFPLRAGCGSARYREAFTRAMDACRAFAPELVIASAGFDAYAKDPIGGLGLAPIDYRWIGAELRKLADDTAEGRFVSALEGGYAVEALPELVGEYVTGAATGVCDEASVTSKRSRRPV